MPIRIAVALSILFLSNLLIAGPCHADAHHGRYFATFEVVPDDSGAFRDVLVTVEVIYDKVGSFEYDGLHFNSTKQVKFNQAGVFDETGQPLEAQIWHEKDTQKFKWAMPSGNKEQPIAILQFLLSDALLGGSERQIFYASFGQDAWGGKLDNFTCCFVFPAGYEAQTLTVSSNNYQESTIDGRMAIEIQDNHFDIGFQPALSEPKKGNYTWLVLVLVAGVAFVVYKVKRGSHMVAVSNLDS
jgi:hypothetical protein